MGITLGGIMRGGLPVATQALLDKPAKLEEDLHNMGQLYGQLAPDAEKAINAAKNNNANIVRIANDLGVEEGIVAAVYASNGGKEQDTRKQVLNMLKAHDNNIPTEETPILQKPAVIDETISVDSAPEAEISKTMMSSFADLFRLHGPDEVIRRFALKTGKSEDYVRKILSGAIGDLIPQFQYGVKPTSEAMLSALETPKEPKSIFSSDTAPGQIFSNVKTVINRVLSPDNQGQYNEQDVKFAQGAINNMITAMANDDAISMALISGRVDKIVPVDKPEDAKVPLKWQTLSKNTETLLGAVINNKDITFDNAKILQLGKAQATAIGSGKEEDWKKVNELYYDITKNKVITQKDPEKKLSPYQKTINDLAVKHLEKNINKGVEYPAGKIEELNKALINAQQNLDNDEAWQVVNLLVKNLKPTYVGDEKTLSAKEQVKSDMFYNTIIKSEHYTNKINSALGDEATLKQIAEEVRKKANELTVAGNIVLDGSLFKENVVVGDDGQVKVYVEPINIGPGAVSELTPKALEEANKNLNSSMTALEDVAFLMGLLKKYPNAYNIIGTTRLELGNLSDIFGSVTGVQLLDQQRTQLQQDAKQRMIGFVSNVKDRLFKDPRLSDQDLKLVKQYIGVIENNTIGESAAQAALVGLERIFTTTIAVGLTDTMPNKTIVVKDEYGGMDLDEDSVARDLLNKMVLASGISSTGKILTKEEYDQNFANNADAGAEYQRELSSLINRALMSTEAMYAFRTDRKAYHATYVTTRTGRID